MKYLIKYCRECYKEMLVRYDSTVFDDKTVKQAFKHLIEKFVICKECLAIKQLDMREKHNVH